MKLNKIDKVWNTANLLFSSVIFRFVLIQKIATMATWRNYFSSLLSSFDGDRQVQSAGQHTKYLTFLYPMQKATY